MSHYQLLPYQRLQELLQDLCNAHHLRELIHAHEQQGQHWAQKLIECLLDAKAEVEAAKGRGQDSLTEVELANEITNAGFVIERQPVAPWQEWYCRFHDRTEGVIM